MTQVTIKDRPATILDARSGNIRIRYEDGTEDTVRASEVKPAIPAGTVVAPPAVVASAPVPVLDLLDDEHRMREKRAAMKAAQQAAKKSQPAPDGAQPKEKSMEAATEVTKGKKSKAKGKPAKKAAKAKRVSNGVKYEGSMAVLREKRGVYQEGKVSVICGDPVSLALDGLTPDQKIKVAAKLVEGVTQSSWAGLNGGQKAMNAANRIRGAVNKGTVTITAVREEAKKHAS